MTQDEIIEIAKKVYGTLATEQEIRFAKLVAAKERETCAEICNEFCYGSTKILIERAIRARGEA